MKRNVMMRAHQIAKGLEGDYRARMSLALRQAWKEVKEMGKLVFGYFDYTPCIYKEKGQHPDYIKGILAVEKVKLLDAIGWNNPILEEVGNGKIVGHRAGGGFTKLIEITQEQADRLIAENARLSEIQKAAREKEEQELAEYEERLANSGLCPKCGTWCYGDCEAN